MKNYVLTLWLSILMMACNMQNKDADDQETKEETPVENRATNQTEDGEKESLKFDFEEAPTEKLPEDWTAHLTGKGNMPVWQVVEDEGNQVLAQLSKDNPSDHFNVIVYDPFEAKDVTLAVRFKGVTGKIDQGGGFVWRFQDANNYYIVRANPLENNVVLYKVENGKRTDLPLMGKGRTYGAEASVPTQQWHDLRLEAKGKLFIVYINEKQLFQVEDETFTDAGKVGFWTKADAVTYFDDFTIN